VNPTLRRAALSLHALFEKDRDWILASLPAEQASALRPLLTELRELGIPADARLLGPLLAVPAAQDVSRPGVGTLDAGIFSALARILESEPAEVTAALVTDDAWPWRTQLLQAFSSAFANDVKRSAAAAVRAPALQAAVREVVGQRLHQLRSSVPTTPPGVWQRWRESQSHRKWT
jgi:hypothetical protein